MTLMRLPWQRTGGFERDMRDIFDIVPFDLRHTMLADMPGFNRDARNTGAWMPEVDIHDAEDAMIFAIDLPGVDPENVHVEVSGNTLTLTGEKIEKFDRQDGHTTLSERIYGNFRRIFRLPDSMILDDVVAEHDHGVLTIRVPKSDRVRSHTVTVTTKEATH